MSDEKITKFKCWAVKERGSELVQIDYQPEPLKDNEVEVKLVASGICASDIDAVRGLYPTELYPFPIIPGHEGVGVVTAIGKLVTRPKVGTRVGLGVYRNACGSCLNCQDGKNNLCNDKLLMFMLGKQGTFSDYIRIKAEFAIPIPDGLKDLESCGPLLCAGVTTYAPFKVHNIRPGQKIAVYGIGGLGHLAIKFARAFGCEVYALSSSPDKADSIKQLGAHHFVDMKKDPELKSVVNTFDYIMVTGSGGDVNFKGMFNALAVNGRIIMLGFPGYADIPVSPVALITQQKGICGMASGSTGAAIEMLNFAALHNILPLVEKFPFSKVNEAITKVKQNKVRYRAVLCHSMQ